MTDKLYLQKLGKKIAVLRKEKRFSQEELADISGKMINTISNIERGLADPKITTLMALAKALNVSLQDLLADEIVSCRIKSDTLHRIMCLLEDQDGRVLNTILKQVEALLEMK